MAGEQPYTIVTAADQAYCALAKGLVCSIRDAERRQGQREQVPIQVIDLGLTDAAVADLSLDCKVLRQPHLPLPSERTDHPRQFLLARVVKPLLRDLFPGYGIYLWLDSDTWVQNWWAIDLLYQGARDAGLSVVPELDRSYRDLYVKDSPHFRTTFAWLVDSFGTTMARELIYRPVFNAGVWAARADSPIWQAWGRRVQAGFRAAQQYVRDQPAFNVALYADKVPFCPLPSLCNWLCCHALPRVQRAALRLTEPLPPFQELGILHLTTEFCHKALPVSWDTGGGEPLALDYLSLKRLRASAAS